jgi:hypothetical protein
VTLGHGETAVLPASLGAHTLTGRDARFLRAWVPDADDADLAAWRAAQPFSVED